MINFFQHRMGFLQSCACIAMLLLMLPATQGEELNHASDYLISVWQTDDGLPQNEVTSLAQTPEGYLWIGLLHGGLARFDGVQFAQYTPFNTPEIQAIEVQSLATDSRGTLWIGPSDASLTTWREGRFTLQRTPQSDGGLRLQSFLTGDNSNIVLAAFNRSLLLGSFQSNSIGWSVIRPPSTYALPLYAADSKGTIWYCNRQRHLTQLAINPSHTDFTTKDFDVGGISAICPNSEGRITIGTSSGIAVWTGEDFEDITPTNSVNSIDVTRMTVAKDGGLWVLESGWIRKLVGSQWTAECRIADIKYRPRSGYFFPDNEGGVWLVSIGEAIWHVSSNGAVAKFTELEGLPSTQITAWLVDRDGNTWFGTSGKGLIRIRKRLFNSLNSSAQSAGAIRSVAEDRNGTLWLGTAAGEVFFLAGTNWSRLELEKLYKSPKTDAVIDPDVENRLWISTMQSGFMLKDGDNLERLSIPRAGPGARVIFHDTHGRVWLGSEFGLAYWQNNQLRKFTTEETGPRCHVTGITEDAKGAVWITTAGCNLMCLSGTNLTTYHSTNSSPKCRFWCALAETNGAIWIGTLGGGLVLFENGGFTHFTTDDGLPDDNINQLLHDDVGNLWGGSLNGIFRIHRRQIAELVRGKKIKIECESFSRSDGLPTVECSGGAQPACWRGADNRLWFATMKGAVWVNPHEAKVGQQIPAVVLEDVLVDGKPAAPATSEQEPASFPDRYSPEASFTAKHVLQVLPGRHYLDINFSGINLSSPEKVRYRWRMDGVDTEWRNGGHSRNAAYSALPHGHFVFHVQASNGGEAWNTDEVKLMIIVLPHWWETWWFKGSLALAIVGLIVGAHRLRVHRLREIERLRLRLARDLHDDVGSKLGAIALLGELIEAEGGSSDGARVRQLATQTIDGLRDIVWFIDPSFDRLSDLVQRMENVAKPLLPGLELDFKQTGDFDSTHLPLAFRRNVIPILKESLSNITKHAKATRVEIRVHRGNGSFKLEIADNGHGFDQSIHSWGSGLRNIRQRAEAMHGTIEFQSSPGAGTRVRLTAPIP